MHMHCVRFARVFGAFGFLAACSGRYNVGQDPAGSGGSQDSGGGAGSSAAGPAVAAGADVGVSDGSGGDMAVAGSVGTTSVGGAAAVTVYCGQTLPTSKASVAFASTDVVWNRIQLFLGSASVVPMPTGLPATMTRDLAGMLTDNTLARFENESAPGL